MGTSGHETGFAGVVAGQPEVRAQGHVDILLACGGMENPCTLHLEGDLVQPLQLGRQAIDGLDAAVGLLQGVPEVEATALPLPRFSLRQLAKPPRATA